ncbi:MAG TPA: VTT domain-containing protein [Marmoricola sp.]|nr:VTT domain-containing protein [Marmoricola sp.]
MILDVIQLGMGWMDPNWWLSQFGQEFFWISVAIIFVECGLFFPFLPGDTLLFAMGLFVATGRIEVVAENNAVDMVVAMAILSIGAFLGNVSGYEIGRRIGPPLAQREGRILKKRYFDQTTAFFDRHGNKALVVGRFVPFVRTYVTVVAGIARMDRRRFSLWSGVGAVLWVVTITELGYLLGKRWPGLGSNIDKAILVILAFSVIPVVYEYVKRRRRRTTRGTAEPADAVGSDVEV